MLMKAGVKILHQNKMEVVYKKLELPLVSESGNCSAVVFHSSTLMKRKFNNSYNTKVNFRPHKRPPGMIILRCPSLIYRKITFNFTQNTVKLETPDAPAPTLAYWIVSHLVAITLLDYLSDLDMIHLLTQAKKLPSKTGHLGF